MLKFLLFPAKLVCTSGEQSPDFSSTETPCAAFYCIPKDTETFYTVSFPLSLWSDTANVSAFGFLMGLTCSSPAPTGPAGLNFPLLTPDSYSGHKSLVAEHLVRAGPASSALHSHVIQCRHGLVAFWTQRTAIMFKNGLHSAVPGPGEAMASRGCRKLKLLFIFFPSRVGGKNLHFVF